MKSTISRFTHMDDWIFEVKMVRALRVNHYGDPYSAVATLTANGEQLYIDSQLTREEDDFSRKDFMTFYRFAQALEMKSVQYDKIKNGVRMSRVIDVVENSQPDPSPYVKLLKQV